MKVTQASMRKKSYALYNRRFMVLDVEHRIWYYARSEDSKKVSQVIKFRDIVDAEMICTMGGMRFGTNGEVFVFRVVTVDKERVFITKTRENAVNWVQALNNARDMEFQPQAENGLWANVAHLSDQDALGEVQRLRSENAWLEQRVRLIDRQKEEELRMKENQIGATMQRLNSVRRTDLELNDEVQRLRLEKGSLEQQIAILEKEKEEAFSHSFSGRDTGSKTNCLNAIQTVTDVRQASDERIMDELNKLIKQNGALREEVALGLQLKRGGGGIVTKERARDLFQDLLHMYDKTECDQPVAFLISPHHSEDAETLKEFATGAEETGKAVKSSPTSTCCSAWTGLCGLVDKTIEMAASFTESFGRRSDDRDGGRDWV